MRLGGIKIVWDEPKRKANLDKHRLDFADVTVDFFEQATILPARARRFRAVGRLKNGVISVIFAVLGSEGVSIISMRPASAAERRLFNA